VTGRLKNSHYKSKLKIIHRLHGSCYAYIYTKNRKTGHKELLAKMEVDRKAAQVKADADREQMQELTKTLQAYQAKTDAVLPAMQVTETSHKETAAAFEPETEEVETMACQEMEARQEEEKPTSADRKPEAAKK
jgi:hypothetical protein